MGAHVSAVPNHQVRRTTSCKMRCEVALGGNFGLELDLTRLSDEDREEIRAQIARIKEIRNTTAKGTFTRLLSPWEGDLTAYQFVDDQKIVFCCYRTLIRANEKPLPIRLRNLKAGERYQDAEGKIYTANDLMHFGILPRMEPRDFSSYVLVLTKI